ncbi:hypothetical protein AAG906_015261 [Vitis piasezkii]
MVIDSHKVAQPFGNEKVASRTISSSSSSDNGDNRGEGGWVEEMVGGYVSQVDPGMSWAQGGENYYATQDTDHGYRLGIWEQRKHLERLTTFPSDDDYSSGHDYHRSNHHRIDEHLQNLGIGSRPGYSNLGIRASDSYGYDQSSSSDNIAYRGFGYYQVVLIPNDLQNHIFLIMDYQANHLTHHIRVMNNSFNHILTTELSPQFVC